MLIMTTMTVRGNYVNPMAIIKLMKAKPYPIYMNCYQDELFHAAILYAI